MDRLCVYVDSIAAYTSSKICSWFYRVQIEASLEIRPFLQSGIISSLDDEIVIYEMGSENIYKYSAPTDQFISILQSDTIQLALKYHIDPLYLGNLS